MPAAPRLLPRLCPSRYQRVQSVPCSRKLDHSPSGLVQGPYVCGVSGTSWVLRGKLISCCEQPVASCGSLGHIWLGASRLMLGQGCGARQEVLISKSIFFFFLASIKSTFHSGRLGVGEKIFCHPGARNLVHGVLYLKPRWHRSAQEGIFLLIFPQAVPSDAAEVCAAYG